MIFRESIKIIIVFGLIILIQGCATTGGSSGNNAKVYNESYNKMVKVVRQAIEGLSLTIEYVDDTKENTITFYFGRRATFNNENIQQDRAIVTVVRIEEQKTRVDIENPDYHYSVPDNQREEYKRKLTDRINDILNN